MFASGKMWSIWARPGKQKDMEGLYLCVEFFSWQANPKEPVPPKPNSIAVLMWSKQKRKYWKQHRCLWVFWFYWYKNWSCWANRSFDESLERSPSDCGVFCEVHKWLHWPTKGTGRRNLCTWIPMCRADEDCSFVQGVMLQHQQLVAFVGSCLQLSWSKHKSPQFVPNDNKLCCFALFLCSFVFIQSYSYLIFSSMVLLQCQLDLSFVLSWGFTQFSEVLDDQGLSSL